MAQARAMPRIVLLQTAVGDYRQQVLEDLVARTDGRFEVYCGPEYFDRTTRTHIRLGENRKEVRNRFLLGRRLLWQDGMWRDVLHADTVILEYNPRILSNWPILLLRKALRKRTVLWGHAWPRTGRDSRTIPLRKVLARLSDAVIVYTETQASELRKYVPEATIIPAPNALYRAGEMGARAQDAAPLDFIYVGRLVKEKKPQLLLEAFLRAAADLPKGSRLVFVGDGPLRRSLEEAASAHSDRVDFKGHVSDPEALATFYASALASVSPGYVGLSITQSLSFGAPMIIARGEPHAPEIEAAQEGFNALFFERDDPSDLARVLIQVAGSAVDWVTRREAIAADCARRYSVDLMASRILEACDPSGAYAVGNEAA